MFSIKKFIPLPEHRKYNFQVFINFLDNKVYGKKSQPWISFKYGSFYLTPRMGADGRLRIDESLIARFPLGIEPDLKPRIYILGHGKSGINHIFGRDNTTINSEALALFIKENILRGRASLPQEACDAPVISLLSCYAGAFTESYASPYLINNSFAARLLRDLKNQNINAIIHARNSIVTFNPITRQFSIVQPSYVDQFVKIDKEINSLSSMMEKLLYFQEDKDSSMKNKFVSAVNDFFISHQDVKELYKKLKDIFSADQVETIEVKEKIKEIISFLVKIKDLDKSRENFFYLYHSMNSKISYFYQGDFQKYFFSYDK